METKSTSLVLMFFVALALQSCGNGGGEDCKPNDHTFCREGVTYWVDSCGNEENKAGDCDCGCNADFTACKDPCDCIQQCDAKECGPDGCGGSCGDCLEGWYCGADGICINPCEGVTCLVCNSCVAGNCEPVQDGTACDDGMWCTVSDMCTGGMCVGDSRDCSEADAECMLGVCNESAGRCEGQPVADGLLCDDGMYCTVNERCNGGVCVGEQNRDCSAASGGCFEGVCDEDVDECVGNPVQAGTSCNDDLFCTVNDTCDGIGNCVGSQRDCSGLSNQCNQGSCSEDLDECFATPVNEDQACDDSLYCTGGETCRAGSCSGGTARDCADGDMCTQDACDEANDECTNQLVPNPGAEGPWDDPTCSDGVDNDCDRLVDDVDPNCQQCQSDGDCEDGNPCTQNTCTDQRCVTTNQPDGSNCDDGLYCTEQDSCSLGVCTGSARDCSSLDTVCTQGVCNPQTEQCEPQPINEGVICEDGQYCTVSETCHSGSCTGGTTRDCLAWDDQCNVGTCDEVGDSCFSDPTPKNGQSCDDDLYCNVGESCSSGSCQGGSSRDCSAWGDQCNVGTCDEIVDGCFSDPTPMNGMSCDDGLYCNVGEICSVGSCQGGSSRDCSLLDDQCNVGACDEVGDICFSDPTPRNGLSCDDGIYCNVGETCSVGSCQGGSSLDCSSYSDQCNQGVCNEGLSECQALPSNEGLACNDGLYCSAGETCQSGSCSGGSGVDCSFAGFECNEGFCDEVNDGCDARPVVDGTPCSPDGDSCTDDICDAGACIHPFIANDCGAQECDVSPSGCFICGTCDSLSECIDANTKRTYDAGTCNGGMCDYPSYTDTTCTVVCYNGDCITGDHVVSRRYGGTESDDSQDVSVDKDTGKILLTGSFNGTADFGEGGLTSWGSSDIVLGKYFTNGIRDWTKSFGGTLGDIGFSVGSDASGFLYLTGVFADSVNFGGGFLDSAGGWDVFLARYRWDGLHMWSKRFGHQSFSEVGRALVLDSQNDVVLLGDFKFTVDFGGGNLPTYGNKDVFLVKFDGGLGDHMWSQSFGGSNNEESKSVALDGSDNILITGLFRDTADFGGSPLVSAGDADIFLAKYGGDGSYMWSKRIGGVDYDASRSVATDDAGNVFITGAFNGVVDFGNGPYVSAGGADIFLVKYDPDGNHIWSKRIGGAGADWGSSLAVDSTGAIIVTGYFNDTVDFGGGNLTPTPTGVHDIFVAKYNTDGGHLWSKRFGGSGQDLGQSVAIGKNNDRIIVTGVFQDTVNFGGANLTSAGSNDVFLLILEP